MRSQRISRKCFWKLEFLQIKSCICESLLEPFFFSYFKSNWSFLPNDLFKSYQISTLPHTSTSIDRSKDRYGYGKS